MTNININFKQTANVIDTVAEVAMELRAMASLIGTAENLDDNDLCGISEILKKFVERLEGVLQ